MIEIKQQTAKDIVWTDDKGMKCPYNRITAIERTKETAAHKIYREAKSISKQLADLKRTIQEKCNIILEAELKALRANKFVEHKGNFTFYCFDKKIKIEVNINEHISFDKLKIELAHQKLNVFLNKGLGDADQFLRDIVNDAFQTRKGNLDPKRVLSLLSYRHKSRSQEFQECCDLIEQSIQRNSSKVYYKVWERTVTGEYEHVELNFSSI